MLFWVLVYVQITNVWSDYLYLLLCKIVTILLLESWPIVGWRRVVVWWVICRGMRWVEWHVKLLRDTSGGLI